VPEGKRTRGRAKRTASRTFRAEVIQYPRFGFLLNSDFGKRTQENRLGDAVLFDVVREFRLRWFRFLLLGATAESGALKANALPGEARRLAVRAVKAAWLSRSSEPSGRALTEAGGPGAGFQQGGQTETATFGDSGLDFQSVLKELGTWRRLKRLVTYSSGRIAYRN
jgi:hypothetical protein